MSLNNCKQYLDSLYLFFGFSILFFMLYPYWLWGNLSALGWYDELHAFVPWCFSKSILFNNLDGFMHGYVGGNRSAFVCVSNNEKISLYRFLITHYDLWLAGLLFRLGGFFLLFTGVYTFIRKVIRHPSAFLAMSVSLTTILVDYIPYGWTLGGIGWDRGIIAWLCIVFFYQFNSPLNRYSLAVVVSMIASVTCLPIFLIPFSFYIFIFYIMVMHDFPIKRQTFLRWSLVWCIFICCIGLNWHDALEHALVQTKGFSSRIQAILSPRTVFSLYDPLLIKLFLLIEYGLRVFYGFLTRKPHQLLMVLYVIAFFLAIHMKLFKKTFIFVFFAFLLPPCFDILFKISDIDYVSKFEWLNLWELQPIMFSFFIVFLLSNKKLNAKEI